MMNIATPDTLHDHADGAGSRAPSDRTLLEGFVRGIAVIVRHKKVVVLTTCMAAVLSIGFVVLSKTLPPSRSPMPNVFTAHAALFVEGNQDAVAGLVTALGTPSAQSGNAEAPNYGDIAIEVLQSRSFLDEMAQEHGVVSHYDLTKDPTSSARKTLVQHASFGFDPTTQILSLEYTDTDPKFAAEMTNGFVDLLQSWFSERVMTAKSRDAKLVAQKSLQAQQRLSSLRAQLEAFQNKYGVLSVDDLSRMRANVLSNLQSQLVMTETEINTRAGLSNIQDPSLARLKSQRDTLESMIRQAQQGTGTFSGTIPAATDLPALADRISQLNTQISIQDKIYQDLSEQSELLSLDIAAQPSFQILERAEVPATKSGPKRMSLVVLVTLAGFVGGIAVAFILNVLPRAKRIYERIS
jgi:uncharacterized protein involved in exopolysaccharide biosynthesis